MTQNQLKAQENELKQQDLKETERKNKAQERETSRHNVEMEKQSQFKNELTGTKMALDFISGKKSKGSRNHPSWTNRFPELTKMVANLAKNPYLGDTRGILASLFGENVGLYSDLDVPDPGRNITVPGAAIIEYSPTLGKTDLDAITIVSAQMYTWLRSVNSGSRNYERSDLIQYLIGGTSIVSLFAYIAKILAISNTFSKTNRFVGDGILHGLEFGEDDISDLRKHYPNYVARLNNLGLRFNAFYLPAVFPLIERWMWMAGATLKDCDSDKSPLLVTKLNHAYLFTTIDPLEGTDTSGKLMPIKIKEGRGTTLDSMLDKLEVMINAYFEYEDMAIIAGDIVHAFGNDDRNYVRIGEFPLGATITPYYDEEDLYEFKNAIPVGKIVEDSLWIRQRKTSHSLVQDGYYTFRDDPVILNGLVVDTNITGSTQEGGELNLPAPSVLLVSGKYANQNVPPEVVMKWLSFKPTIQDGLLYRSDTSKWFRIVTEFRTEVISKVIIYTFRHNQDGMRVDSIGLYDNAFTAYDADNLAGALVTDLYYVNGSWQHAMLSMMNIINTFHHLPSVSEAFTIANVPGIFIRKFNHVNPSNFAPIPKNTKSICDNVALMSLYGMDVFGTSNRYQGKYDISKKQDKTSK